MRLAISWLNDNLRIYPEIVRATEEAGFELLGVPDTQVGAYRECYVTLTTAALNSTRMRIGTWVTFPLTRHPAVTASALASLNELAPGRVFGAFGTGFSGVYNLGLRPARLSTLEAYVKAVRTLLQGQPAEWQGKTAHLLWPKGGIPLYMGAGGPRALELAGAEADGVAIAVGVSPEAVAVAEQTIARGAAQAGRDPGRLERWWLVRGSIADTYEEALTWALPAVLGTVNHAFAFTFEGKAVPERWHEPIRQLEARYVMTEHNRPSTDNPNSLLGRELGLVDFAVDRFGVLGTPRQVVERLRELEARGVTGVCFRFLTPDPLRLLRVWRDEVAPALR